MAQQVRAYVEKPHCYACGYRIDAKFQNAARTHAREREYEEIVEIIESCAPGVVFRPVQLWRDLHKEGQWFNYQMVCQVMRDMRAHGILECTEWAQSANGVRRCMGASRVAFHSSRT